MRAGLLALAGTLVAAALVGPGGAIGAIPAGNLLQDPGAEQAAAGQIPGWTLKDGFTAVDYGNTGGFPAKEEGARIGGGAYFFAGGESARSTATQAVDVSQAAAEIDAGRVVAKLGGWLGGFAGQGDSMELAAAFTGASGEVLGRAVIPGPRPDARKGQTVLMAVARSAAVPAGTRSIQVVLTSTREAGSWNDGTADNVSLVLSATGAAAPAAPAAAAPAAGAATATGPNLVANGGAEQLAGGKLAGWTQASGFTALEYGASGGFPDAAVAKAVNGGARFFTGGESSRSTATQLVDLASRAAAIDRGGVKALLSAYVGGFAGQPDWAKVYATFRDGAGKALGAVAIGPVTPAARKGQTTLLYRAGSAAVPAGTRSVLVAIVAVRGAGSWNDGNVDNVSLVLK